MEALKEEVAESSSLKNIVEASLRAILGTNDFTFRNRVIRLLGKNPTFMDCLQFRREKVMTEYIERNLEHRGASVL